ncbi:hypothetical protein L600_003000000390, partial [Isoptericola variabilis J7]
MSTTPALPSDPAAIEEELAAA